MTEMLKQNTARENYDRSKAANEDPVRINFKKERAVNLKRVCDRLHRVYQRECERTEKLSREQRKRAANQEFLVSRQGAATAAAGRDGPTPYDAMRAKPPKVYRSAENTPVYEPGRIRVLGIAAGLAALLTLNGCQTLNSDAVNAPFSDADYGKACSYFMPALKQHSAFGTDSFVLCSEDLTEAQMQQVAAELRRHGAAVQLEPAVRSSFGPSYNPVDMTGVQGELRYLQFSSSMNGDNLLLALGLEDELLLYCAFMNFEGELTPISAVSIERRG